MPFLHKKKGRNPGPFSFWIHVCQQPQPQLLPPNACASPPQPQPPPQMQLRSSNQMIRSQLPLPPPKPAIPFAQPFPPQQHNNRRMYSKQLSFPPKQPIRDSSLREFDLSPVFPARFILRESPLFGDNRSFSLCFFPFFWYDSKQDYNEIGNNSLWRKCDVYGYNGKAGCALQGPRFCLSRL